MNLEQIEAKFGIGFDAQKALIAAQEPNEPDTVINWSPETAFFMGFRPIDPFEPDPLGDKEDNETLSYLAHKNAISLRRENEVGGDKWMDAQDQIQEMNRHEINPHLEEPEAL